MNIIIYNWYMDVLCPWLDVYHHTRQDMFQLHHCYYFCWQNTSHELGEIRLNFTLTLLSGLTCYWLRQNRAGHQGQSHKYAWVDPHSEASGEGCQGLVCEGVPTSTDSYSDIHPMNFLP